MLEFVTLSLFLSLPIYLYLQEVFISHQDWRFCLRHMWQEEPQRSWDTDGQIGSCEGMEPGGTMRPRGLQRWCPSLALHPRGPSPRASLPAAGPRLLPAPAAPSRPCFSPFPVAFADSSYSPLWRSATRSGGKRGFRDTRSTVRGAGSKFRKAPPSGERGENWGSASDEERTSDDAGRGWGRRAGACHGSRRRDGPQGCCQGEGWSPGLLWEPSFCLSAHFIIPEGSGPDSRTATHEVKLSKGERLGHWGLSRWCRQASCGSVILASSERFWRNWADLTHFKFTHKHFSHVLKSCQVYNFQDIINDKFKLNCYFYIPKVFVRL